ncbi:hypothetical protein M378DRAFT_126439 [Amanita muscaria Koide BX008]|uniref:Conserved oligomeric Golgi complex subunit 3 n=1 Tax=Amanita muscaria (strain Koide BX008) TaxID=946122 RepID=A0A0C2X796_AMAMK|nr:hypothetical protein M378DRAFT_126439 [Amanita muscaria Koide BX008]
MSNRVGRRAPLSVAPSPHPTPILNIEEWETKAPLADVETRSVSVLKAASEIVPLPLKFVPSEDGYSRPSTPIRSKLAPGSRTSTPPVAGTTHALPSSYASLHPKQPIQTQEQFYDWFSLIDRSVAHSQESHFRAHIAEISEHLETCDALLHNINTVESEVDGMFEHWRIVEEGGRSLKDACERLLQERDKLLDLTDEIGTRLDYFQELEHATRMLNHPGESLVLQTDFLYMVERVDICIDFLKNHRHYKEAELYLLRFHQCMTRAMTLIKMFFIGSLRALSSDISKRMNEKDVSSTAQMHLLYTRFRSVAAQLAPLLGELERRSAAHPDELSALLSECHAAYFSTRKSLLVNRLTEEIKDLDPARTEIVELTRAGCTYLKHLCTDEFYLYREFFSSGEDALYGYLEGLCDYLYDDLRPRILHEPRITALCEVCTVLQALMVLDVTVVPDTVADEDEDVDELLIDLDLRKSKKGLNRLHISHLLQMVLQDAQTRLFFKAQSMIQSDIRQFTPAPEDLNYPEILRDARKPASSTGLQEKESFSLMFQLPSLDKQDTWYPTLQKTVWILSQLHDFVKPTIFEDIAQEAVGLCRHSLVIASDAMKLRATTLDAYLFLVRHLLILKDLVHKLDLEHHETEKLIGFTDTLTAMLNKTTSLFPGALFSTLGIPRAEETIEGAKSDIDHDLRRTCENVITYCVAYVCRPITSWTDRVREHAVTSKPSTIAAETWANQAAVEELDRNFREAADRDLRSSVNQIRFYLEDERTVNVLVTHVLERVVEEYTAFREVALGMHADSLRGTMLATVELGHFLQDVSNGSS